MKIDQQRGLLYFCIFLITSSVLALEVSFTRVFSVISLSYMTFVVISLATLGLGVAGSLYSNQKQIIKLPWNATYFGLATLLSFFFITSFEYTLIDTYKNIQIFYLFSSQIALAIPFFFAGSCLVNIVSLYYENIHQIYFSDLIGASAGCLASVIGIWCMGTTNLIFFISFIGAVSGLLLTYVIPMKRIFHWICAIGLGFVWVWGMVYNPYLVNVGPEKDLHKYVNRTLGTKNLDESKWHFIARIDITKPMVDLLPWFGGNISEDYRYTRVEYRFITQDGGAPTGILKSDGDINKMSYLGAYLQALPYSMQKNPRVLVIGVGGGIDILIALFHHAKDVTAVELNPLMVNAITKDYANYAGRYFNQSNVKVLQSEGRHFLSSDHSKYDVIQLSGVDTFTALSTGAYAFAENYLYTVEAIKAELDRLSLNGVLSYSRWFLTPPRETLRLAGMAVEALEESGVQDAANHLIIVHGLTWADTLVKKNAFTFDEVQTIRQWVKKNGYEMTYDPFVSQLSVYDKIIRSNKVERANFASNYLYNVTPVRDDFPYFFNYFRWAHLLDKNSFGAYGSYGPVSLFTMLWSLAQIIVIAVIGILLPLRQNKRIKSVNNFLIYFGALGLGFMFVEITFIQKLMFFMGGPTIAMAFTLSIILFFSGLGSLFARRWKNKLENILLIIFSLIAVLIISDAFIIDPVISNALSFGWPLRSLVALILIAPIAFLLGMPFPLGLSILGNHFPKAIPWGWAINSFMTVLGPLLCILFSIQLGFKYMFFLAAFIYFIGFLSLRLFFDKHRF